MRILFVCTGNLCRSPMAERMLRHRCAGKLGVTVAELPSKGIVISSAGTHAMSDREMPVEARRVLSELGVDGEAHKSRPVTERLLREVDVVYVAAREHAELIRVFAPLQKEKVRLLDSVRDVLDPIGEPIDVFRESRRQIERALDRVEGEWAGKFGDTRRASS